MYQKAVDLLNLLQKNLPEKTGEKAAWNFEKAHSILRCAALKKSATREDQAKRAVETRRRRKAARPSLK